MNDRKFTTEQKSNDGRFFELTLDQRLLSGSKRHVFGFFALQLLLHLVHEIQ